MAGTVLWAINKSSTAGLSKVWGPTFARSCGIVAITTTVTIGRARELVAIRASATAIAATNSRKTSTNTVGGHASCRAGVVVLEIEAVGGHDGVVTVGPNPHQLQRNNSVTVGWNLEGEQRISEGCRRDQTNTTHKHIDPRATMKASSVDCGCWMGREGIVQIIAVGSDREHGYSLTGDSLYNSDDVVYGAEKYAACNINSKRKRRRTHERRNFAGKIARCEIKLNHISIDSCISVRHLPGEVVARKVNIRNLAINQGIRKRSRKLVVA